MISTGGYHLALLIALCLHHLDDAIFVVDNHLKKAQKPLEITRLSKKTSPFRGDQDILRYLNLHGREMRLWKCKNVIQTAQPLRIKNTYIDLNCEVIGTMKSVKWQHNYKDIKIGKRRDKYFQRITPHSENDKYFSRWIDFRLRIRRPSSRDAGLYTFSAVSPSGQTDQQMIFVDVGNSIL